MNKKWLVLSDYVISRNDGDKHFITCARLCHLYGVNPKECVFGQIGDGKRYPNLPILAPRYDGDYSLPNVTHSEQNGQID
jgi:hypothetical protein